MKCKKCGFENKEGTKFCVKCGNPMDAVVQAKGVSSSGPKEPINYFFFILAIVLKPMTFFKEELKRFNEMKFSVIFAAIITGIATSLTLISTMISSVIVKNYDWLSGSTVTTWTWDNLKNIDYIGVIGRTFLLYALVLLVISGVYYLAGLVIKKQLNFYRLLGITSASVIVAVIGSMLISPILGSIYFPLGVIVTAVGAVYSLLILIEGMNDELKLDNKDVKVQFNVICLSIIFVVAYIVLMQFVSSAIGGGSTNIINMLK